MFVFLTFVINAQEGYWTNYHFVVTPEDESTVYKLMDDYFKANKPEGITVSLWENHFNDHGNNWTHSINFSGSLEDMGNFYNKDLGTTWDLMLVKLNQHIKEGYSSKMGTRKSHVGDLNQNYPVQKYFIVHADDGAAWDAAYNKFSKANNPIGVLNMMGNYSSGVSPKGENRWVINGFKDFKSAIGGGSAMRTSAEQAATDKAWKVFRDTNGESHLVRSGTRVRVGQWK